MLTRNLFFALFALLAIPVSGQSIGNYLGDESALLAETKQVNQFFRRFNAEEDKSGKKLFTTDKHYRDSQIRRKYIRILFDEKNNFISEADKEAFIESVTDAENPQFLDFHADGWFAEVQTRFLYKGRRETIKIFLKLEQENLGYKWVMKNVFFSPFSEIFYSDTTSAAKFLHPMSHELDFMNLVKVFKDNHDLIKYTAKEFQPDFLTLFLYEFKKGSLTFETVEKVNFHFFQAENYYFELSEFNRPGYNRGWLISNLTKIPDDQKEVLLQYIYQEK